MYRIVSAATKQAPPGFFRPRCSSTSVSFTGRNCSAKWLAVGPTRNDGFSSQNPGSTMLSHFDSASHTIDSWIWGPQSKCWNPRVHDSLWKITAIISRNTNTTVAQLDGMPLEGISAHLAKLMHLPPFMHSKTDENQNDREGRTRHRTSKGPPTASPTASLRRESHLVTLMISGVFVNHRWIVDVDGVDQPPPTAPQPQKTSGCISNFRIVHLEVVGVVSH